MSSAFHGLPAELVLRILSYLPLQSLRALRLASRSWNTFFLDNESSIYHHAAVLHRFIDSIHTLLPEAKEAHPLKFLEDVPNWYEYCRKYLQLQLNWLGKGFATARHYGGHPFDIHRIKVDEQYGLLITTHEFGGLTVFDVDTADVLWQLDQAYIRRYAHCEYENGYLIFDRLGSAKEIWRLDDLYDIAERPVSSSPDDEQMRAWRRASRAFARTGPRGHFRPWALIETPDPGRALRFVYPTLLVCGIRKAYLWDACTASLLLEVDNIQGISGSGDINYVELSAAHIFVCSTSALRVFSRRNAEMVLEIQSYQLVYSDVRLAVQLDPAIARQKVADAGEAVCLPAEPAMSTALYTASYAEFTAVHVSRDGKDLVAQLSDSRLLVIRDFQRVIRGEVSLKTATLEIGKTISRLGASDEHFSIYLSYEHGRLGIVTTSGVYTATLDPTYHYLIDEDLVSTGRRDGYHIPQSAINAGLSFPYITFVSLPFYHDRRQLAKVTCIQITETKLYFVWDAMYKPENIDFFRQLGMIGGTPPTDRDGGDNKDDLEQGLFTTADTLVQETGYHADAPPGGDDGTWHADGVDESQALSPSGSGLHAPHPQENARAGPSTTVMNAAGEDEDYADEDEDEDGWQGDDSDADSAGEPEDVPHPLAGLGHDTDILSTGPIVFCIDFSPQ